MAKIAFKSDNQKQSLLLPPSLDELIPLTHSVRVVNAMIDRLDVDAILRTYRRRREQPVSILARCSRFWFTPT